MHYEFIQTRTTYETHDRASLREGVLSDVWNFPTIMNYELRIKNYEEISPTDEFTNNYAL